MDTWCTVWTQEIAAVREQVYLIKHDKDSLAPHERRVPGGAASSEIQMPADEQIPEATLSYAAPAVSGFSINAGLVDGGTGDDGSILGIGYTVDAGATTVALSLVQVRKGYPLR